jgi:hypothetical protein
MKMMDEDGPEAVGLIRLKPRNEEDSSTKVKSEGVMELTEA